MVRLTAPRTGVFRKCLATMTVSRQACPVLVPGSHSGAPFYDWSERGRLASLEQMPTFTLRRDQPNAEAMFLSAIYWRHPAR